MTFDEAYRSCAGKFRDAGIKDSDVDAFLLMQYVTGKSRSYILSEGREAVLTEEEERKYFLLAEKREGRIPLQLIMGETEFMGLSFAVRPGVLIPRIDTEFLVEEAMREVSDGMEVLDLCTGSGCVLLSLMNYKNGIKGLGVDISEKALALAKENAERLKAKDVSFIKGDMFAALSEDRRFDAILCNPPYIKSREIPTLMPEVRLYEPKESLDGGGDGLDFYRILAKEAALHLYPEGRIFMEIGADEGEDVKKLFRDAGYLRVEAVRDYAGNERVVKCSRS
ncbi:MAG: peptide chain release factor N(5)-glutamine methyltransferase [Lachnospiraceae bacterium]|nr:peptide chain release factor N(5)-glutamine methyltransferase [Lachnospiraceae bacterium]